MVSMTQAFVDFWKNYVNFMGRATRAQYWWVSLWMIIIFTPLVMLIPIFAIGFGGEGIVYVLVLLLALIPVGLAILIPSMSLLVRRYRDTGLPEPLVWVLFGVQVVIGAGANTMRLSGNNGVMLAGWSLSGLIDIASLVMMLLPSNTFKTK